MPKRTREKIAERAYELYLQRGGKGGNDLQDWLQAEHEIAGNKNSPKNWKSGSKRPYRAKDVLK
ncbi:MAG: DUF2934 domain-containing protein [Chitinivibrionales bacterium]|nr:DUF2934 domain-containing protein [Chitinivibrionales bacterium]